ncbi:MAG: hypothetical protein ABIT05_03365 [Chitinophagaceae bacterium]
MKKVWITAALLVSTAVSAQKINYTSIAVFTTQNAMPFGKFTGLFSETLHPGIEAGYGKIFSAKKKHEWTAELKLAYFYHRFVQHGIPLYLNMGYRYLVKKNFSIETSLGAGYMHSIPATAKLKLNNDGEYENNKGIGRMQSIVTFNAGVGYILHPRATRPTRIFASYQQRVQFPFVKSYVPLLPYNSFIIGLSRPLYKKNN